MKRFALILALMLLGTMGTKAQDVVRDSTATVAPAATVDTIGDNEDDDENVIGGRVDSTYLKRKKSASNEQNVIGAPVYYSITDSRPRHHYLNALENQFCSFFIEAEALVGPGDIAGGFNFTYLPDRWGVYGSALFGVHHDYLAVGPALRLSSYDSDLDWHLYGGLVFGGRHVGSEAGIRMALPRRDSQFSWTSASMGLGCINGDVYLTLGLSLEFVAVGLLGSILFW